MSESISDRIMAGVPNLDTLKHKGEGFGHIGLSPVVPLEGARVRDVVDKIWEIVERETGFNYKGSIALVGERSGAVVSSINFDPRSEEETTLAYQTAHLLVDELASMGYSEYRAHLDFMEDVAGYLSFNNHAYRRFVERIKDAVDPNGILSPGRYGIWPERMRTGR